MSKKDFSQIDAGAVYDAINTATSRPRRTYSPEELEAFKEAGATSGRKGAKMPRLNIALTPTSYDYVKVMSSVLGMTSTKFINRLVEEHMKRNLELYAKIREFGDDMNSL